MANNALSYFNGGKKSAYCPEIENYAKEHKRFIDKKHGKKGDIALMDFGEDRASHTGIVEAKNDDGSYTIIEGNTSTSSNDNGGKVMRRVRTTKHIRGFYRPKYDDIVTANMIVEKAKSQIGTKEIPAGSNKVKYNTWYYGREVSGSAYPWCMVLVSWVFAHTEVKAKSAKSNTTTKPTKPKSNTKTNTAKPKTSARVKQYQHAYNISYKTELTEDGILGKHTKDSFKKVLLKKGTKHKATIIKFVQGVVGAEKDGIFGDDTKAKVIAFQKKHELIADGIVGHKTIEKMVK